MVGVRRAAIGVGATWAAVVVLPALVTADLPAVLQPGSVPIWALATVAFAAYAATRTADYRALSSHN